MKLTKLYMDGYRNIDQTEIDLHDLTALVAVNNSGKSNVFSAAAFALDFIKASPERKKIFFQSEDNIPAHKTNPGKNFSFQIEGFTTLKEEKKRKKSFFTTNIPLSGNSGHLPGHTSQH